MTFYSIHRRGGKGFTLIELMVVVAILGVLASIITVSLGSARAKGRDAKRISDIRTIQLALEEYYNDNNTYPVTLSGLQPTYLSTMPVDPKDNFTPYSYTTYNSNASQNCAPPAGKLPVGYHLGAGLEDATNPALLHDAGGSATPNFGSLVNCGQSPGFNGSGGVNVNSTTGVVQCSTAALPIGVNVSQCYDVTN